MQWKMPWKKDTLMNIINNLKLVKRALHLSVFIRHIYFYIKHIEFGIDDIVRSGLVKEYLLAKLEMGI